MALEEAEVRRLVRLATEFGREFEDLDAVSDEALRLSLERRYAVALSFVPVEDRGEAMRVMLDAVRRGAVTRSGEQPVAGRPDSPAATGADPEPHAASRIRRR